MPTIADMIDQMPMPYDECKQLAVVFPDSLVQPLVNAQAWYGSPQFQAQPIPLKDGRWMLPGALLSEIPSGLYGAGFSRLNAANFGYCEVVDVAEVFSMFYGQSDGTPPSLPTPEPQPEQLVPVPLEPATPPA